MSPVCERRPKHVSERCASVAVATALSFSCFDLGVLAVAMCGLFLPRRIRRSLLKSPYHRLASTPAKNEREFGWESMWSAQPAKIRGLLRFAAHILPQRLRR